MEDINIIGKRVTKVTRAYVETIPKVTQITTNFGFFMLDDDTTTINMQLRVLIDMDHLTPNWHQRRKK